MVLHPIGNSSHPGCYYRWTEWSSYTGNTRNNSYPYTRSDNYHVLTLTGYSLTGVYICFRLLNTRSYTLIVITDCTVLCMLLCIIYCNWLHLISTVPDYYIDNRNNSIRIGNRCILLCNIMYHPRFTFKMVTDTF